LERGSMGGAGRYDWMGQMAGKGREVVGDSKRF